MNLISSDRRKIELCLSELDRDGSIGAFRPVVSCNKVLAHVLLCKWDESLPMGKCTIFIIAARGAARATDCMIAWRLRARSRSSFRRLATRGTSRHGDTCASRFASASSSLSPTTTRLDQRILAHGSRFRCYRSSRWIACQGRNRSRPRAPQHASRAHPPNDHCQTRIFAAFSPPRGSGPVAPRQTFASGGPSIL